MEAPKNGGPKNEITWTLNGCAALSATAKPRSWLMRGRREQLMGPDGGDESQIRLVSGRFGPELGSRNANADCSQDLEVEMPLRSGTDRSRLVPR